MATEPTAVKGALAVAAVAALGPLAGEYALILMGAFGGALLALQRAEPFARWWQPLAHVAGSVIAGMMFTGVASAAAAHALPESWGIATDMLWLPVAAAVAMYWRDAAGLVPGWLKRRTDNDGGKGGAA